MLDKKIQKIIGMRIAYAREKSGFTQASLSERLGFSDRQTLSSIEKGHRQVSTEEILKISELLERPVTWLLDPFLVFGKGTITWRVDSKLSDEDFSSLKEKYGSFLGFTYWLLTRNHSVNNPISSSLEIDINSSIGEAVVLGERMAGHLSLNVGIPTALLPGRMLEFNYTAVLYADEKPETGRFYGAVCKADATRIVLVNRNEGVAQRNYSIARGLFQSLTWNILTPPEKVYASNSDFLSIEKGTKNRVQKIEKLTHAFVAGLLMPKATLSRYIQGQETVSEWQELAQKLQVPVKLLAFKLLHDRVITNSVFAELVTLEDLPGEETVSSLYPSWLLNYLADAINEGHISVRKTMRMLNCTRDELLEIFRFSESKIYIGS